MQEYEWTKYKVGTPSPQDNYIEQTCRPFDSVHHICHLKDALRIIEDGSIRSSLIWDESRLNNTRTCVSWLSPNDWGFGSIYGNVQFNFNWADIISDKKFYWVEAIHYRPHAYRILITDLDYTSQGLFHYNPEAGDGPIYFDRMHNIWYRNNKYTGELMFDRDLDLDECTSIEFISHHKTKCKNFGSNCEYLKSSPSEIGARFISSVVFRDIQTPRRLLTNIIEDEDIIDINSSTTMAISHLLMKLCDNNETTTDEILSLGDKALAKAILSAYSIGDNYHADILANILRQSCSVKTALISILEEYFGESTLEIFYSDI